ncbi:hypothetical protein ACLB2K_023198 [Fragaria x ananassa]
MEELFSCCPVLEDLSINGTPGQYGDEGVLNFTVSAPELKTLKVHWYRHGVVEKCNFHVVAPKLENFHILQYPSTECYLENAKSLVRVTIALQYHFADEDRLFALRGTTLFAGISNDFKCPGASSNHEWSPPDSVPICLLTHLKTISIRGFRGKQDEMDAAKYLLMNGEVLKNMTFYSEDLSFFGLHNEDASLTKEEEIYQELSLCKWGSKTCQVEFYGDQKDDVWSLLGLRSWF